MILNKSPYYTIYVNPTKEERETFPEGMRRITLKLNSLTFGFATNTFWHIIIFYHGPNNWNFEKPKLPTYYQTPFSVLRIVPKPIYATPAPNMPMGYKSDDMRTYINKDFPEGYIKLAWHYPCPHIDLQTKYVHPGEDRLLSRPELEALFGCSLTEIPAKIKTYLEKHCIFYLDGAWKEQDFEADFDKFIDSWKVVSPPKSSKHKVFNYAQYTPRLVCMESDVFPKKPLTP